MHQHPPLPALTAALLTHLDHEEALLRDAHTNVTGLHAALCRGDLAGGRAICAGQPALAAALRAAAEARATASAQLARELGLSGNGITLAALAARLPEELAAGLLAARTRLTALAADLSIIQARNANLLVHLRSFFRGVLSGLTAADAPPRYGPSGRRLEFFTGSAVQGRG
jgi:hypothetical protein